VGRKGTELEKQKGKKESLFSPFTQKKLQNQKQGPFITQKERNKLAPRSVRDESQSGLKGKRRVRELVGGTHRSPREGGMFFQ